MCLYFFIKQSLLVSLILCYSFSFYFIYFHSVLCLPYINFGLGMFLFFWFLIRLLIWEHSFFLMYTFIVINFPLRTSFAPSVKLWWYSFSFREGNGTPLQYSCWKIPWMEEPGGLQSMGSLRVRHDWVTPLSHIGEGNGNPLQCSCLENPKDAGAWWAAIYGVAQSRTRLTRLSSIYICIPKDLSRQLQLHESSFHWWDFPAPYFYHHISYKGVKLKHHVYSSLLANKLRKSVA